MSDFKSYEFSVKIRTNRKPKEELWRIVQKLKDVVPVLSIEYNLIDDRPTTVEHHGGTDVSTKLSTSQQESSEADIETPSY
jgi:hypothetical protein